jgi:hypothetical protein
VEHYRHEHGLDTEALEEGEAKFDPKMKEKED